MFLRYLASSLILLPVPCLAQANRRQPHFREFITSAAMEAMFGNFDAIDGYAKWQPTKTKPQGRQVDDAWYARILLDEPYIESGQERHLLVTSSLPEDQSSYNCHACQVIISAAVFSRTADIWSLVAKNLYVTRAGEFGEVPRAELQQIGPNHFGFRLETSHTGQGVGTRFSLVGVSGTTIIPLLAGWKNSSFETDTCDATNSAVLWESCVEYDGGISLLSGPNPEYFDILVTRRVTHSMTRKIPQGTYAFRYQYEAGKYLLKQQLRR
jgi:hypothetical protein